MRFASDISIFWLLPWLAISIYLEFFFYRNVSWLNEMSRKWRIALISLRSTVLFLIGVLILGLILETVKYRQEKPVLITLVDNSSSMENYKDSASVKKNLLNYQTAIQERFGEKYDFVDMIVGSKSEYSKKVDFSDPISNLYAGFEKINEDFYNRNIGGIILISDGNFNEGSNPTYAAEKISLTPVFALRVGDTVQKKDQYIKNVASNEVAFLKNKFPVEVDLEGIKMGKRDVTVRISKNNKQVASQTVKYSGNSVDFQHVSFLLEADQIGFQAYTVSVSDVENEYNYQNNRRTFYVEVIDSRSKVLIIAGAPHPDVAAIKQELEKDENLEVVSVLTKDWNKELKKVDLIVLHEPGLNADPASWQLIEKSKIPVLMSIGPNSTSAGISALDLGITLPNGKQTDENQGTINEAFGSFEISPELKKSMEFYPPLKTKFGDMRVSGAEILAFQRIGNVKKKDPLIFFLKKSNVKYGVIYGEGLWKWRINEFARTGEQKSFNELIMKITQFLLVKQNTAALRVTLPKRFTKNEEVIVNASFYNEAMDAIISPKIDFSIKNEDGKVSKYQFGTVGNLYKLSLGKLKPGKYEWMAKASHNGKSFSKSGVFVVEEIDLELLTNAANQSVLNQLASTSNGAVYPLKDFEKLLNSIEKRGDITTVEYREASFDGLIDYKWIFFLLLMFLTAEWFLRRWLGAY